MDKLKKGYDVLITTPGRCLSGTEKQMDEGCDVLITEVRPDVARQEAYIIMKEHISKDHIRIYIGRADFLYINII